MVETYPSLLAMCSGESQLGERHSDASNFTHMTQTDVSQTSVPDTTRQIDVFNVGQEHHSASDDGIEVPKQSLSVVQWDNHSLGSTGECP